MNVHSTAPTDPDAFLRWNEGREGKRELVKGKVVEMMTGATWGHARRIRRLARVLEDRLDATRFEVATIDIGVRTPAGVRYPDILVDRFGNDPESLVASAPVLIIEVLSPSSIAIDMVEKAAEYTSLPSLHAYIVMAQHDPNMWVWLREDDRWRGPTKVDGQTGLIEVPPLGLAIPFKEFYPDFRTE
jgi:Uma2 family endonuclease